jgi:ubiquitin carboxyl-terminal hydrolase 34
MILSYSLMSYSQVRLWMNFTTASRYVAQIRRHIVQYMCRFTEKDLRLAATRNMTDLVWQTLKEPRSSIALAANTGEVSILDRDGLELAFKYFTCSMLTLRLAGIAQINVSYPTDFYSVLMIYMWG